MQDHFIAEPSKDQITITNENGNALQDSFPAIASAFHLEDQTHATTVQIENETYTLYPQEKAAIAGLWPERQQAIEAAKAKEPKMISREELEKSLEHPLASWSHASKEEVEQKLGKDVAAMVGFDQHNPHHCYELFDHCLHTAEEVAKMSQNTDLRVAALIHDIGKPDVAREKDGRLVFYDHALKSAQKADPLLEQWGYTGKEKEEIKFYVKNHDAFISSITPEKVAANHNRYLLPLDTEHVKERLAHLVAKDIGLFKTEQDVSEKLKNLVTIMRADAKSQSDVARQVNRFGKVTVTTKEDKLEKIDYVQQGLEQSLKEILPRAQEIVREQEQKREGTER